MSGIVGIIHFDGAPVAPSLIETMTSAMAYRGPDGMHHWNKGSVAFGQCMLHTTPESLEETQPLTNEDESLVLVMDGRVDNWEELRRELLLHGAVLRDRSDAELVLRSFETWGHDCLRHIDGDFALVIWDARRQQAFCARDRIGNKPLHYHWIGKTLVFASELHPILAMPWVPQEPNDGMLAEFLAHECQSSDETLWNGILRLLAAHRMVVGSSGPQLGRYWEPDLWATLPFRDDQEYIDHYRELLTESVRRMSRSHRPVAFQVSGGLDSSALFGVAEHLRRDARLPAPGIEGYTLAFTAEGDANELVYARALGEHLGLAIHEIPPSIPALEWFAELARVYREFPGFPNNAMFTGIRQRAAMGGSRALLTGEGGDEWLYGSRTYYAEELAKRHWRTLRDCFRIDASAFGSTQAMRWFIRQGVVPLLPVAIQQGMRRVVRAVRQTGAREPYWLSPEMRAKLAHRRQKFHTWHHLPLRSVVQRNLLTNLNNALSDQVLEHADRLTARVGIEMRSPFRERRLIQFAFATPERLRLRGHRTKFIHVEALPGILPQAILERTSKAEFSVVFHEHLERLREALTSSIPVQRSNWITTPGMARLFQSYRDNPQFGWQMWALWGVYGCDSIGP